MRLRGCFGSPLTLGSRGGIGGDGTPSNAFLNPADLRSLSVSAGATLQVRSAATGAPLVLLCLPSLDVEAGYILLHPWTRAALCSKQRFPRLDVALVDLSPDSLAWVHLTLPREEALVASLGPFFDLRRAVVRALRGHVLPTTGSRLALTILGRVVVFEATAGFTSPPETQTDAGTAVVVAFGSMGPNCSITVGYTPSTLTASAAAPLYKEQRVALLQFIRSSVASPHTSGTAAVWQAHMTRVLLLSGPAGVGKSTVLTGVIREATLELGVRVVHLVASAEGLQSTEAGGGSSSTSDRIVYVFEDLDGFFGADSSAYSVARAQLTCLLDELSRCVLLPLSTHTHDIECLPSTPLPNTQRCHKRVYDRGCPTVRLGSARIPPSWPF
jgi:hypothetical protein